MATIKISFEIIWVPQSTKLEKCIACEEIIYSRVYRMFIKQISDEPKYPATETDVCLCQSCYD